MVTAPESGNGNLSTVTPDGKITNIATVEGTFIGPGITISDSGAIFIPAGDRLLKFTADGKSQIIANGFIRCFDVKLDRKGNIYVADDIKGVVYKITADGTKEILYISNHPGQFMLTSLCLDHRQENLFVRDGGKLLKFSLGTCANIVTPTIVLDSTNIFYFCNDSSDNIYASTIKSAIKLDTLGNIENLSSEELKTSLGVAIGCKEFGDGKVYVTVDDGIVVFPLQQALKKFK